MSARVVPYELLRSASWNVEALIVHAGGNQGEQVTLKEVAWFNKRTVNKSEIVPDHVYVYVDLSCVSRDNGMIETSHSIKGMELPLRARIMARKGDILVPIVRPGQGAVAIVPPELDGCMVSSGFAVLTPMDCPGEVLYFILRSETVNLHLAKMASGAIPAIKLRDLKDYPIALQHISPAQVEKAISLYREWFQVNHMPGLEQVIDEVFAEKLNTGAIPEHMQDGYYIMDYGRLRDMLHPLLYMNFPAGLSDHSSPTARLGDIASFRPFGFSPLKHLYSTEPGSGSVPYLQSANIRRDMLNLNLAAGKTTYIQSKHIEKYEQKKLNAQDLVIVTRGPYLGRCALVQAEAAGALMNQNLTAITCSEKVLPEYLLCFLKTSNMRHFFEARIMDFYLPVNLLKEIVVPLPSPEKQAEIVAAIEEHPAYRGLKKIKNKIAKFTDGLVSPV